jgi:hypothetical protein
MPYVPFSVLFPELSKKETRVICLDGNTEELGLPPDRYAFLEMYCNEENCDCRRVFFIVCSETTEKQLAVITWGWESLEFYRDWASFDPDPDPEMIREMKGPVLNMGSPQSEHADKLLELTEDVLLQDDDYIERIKRHYKMFREKIDHPYRIDPGSLKDDAKSVREKVAALKKAMASMPRKELEMLKRQTAILLKKEALLKKNIASLKKKNRKLQR